MSDTFPFKAVVSGGSAGIGKTIVHEFPATRFTAVTADIQETDDLFGHIFPADLIRPSDPPADTGEYAVSLPSTMDLAGLSCAGQPPMKSKS